MDLQRAGELVEAAQKCYNAGRKNEARVLAVRVVNEAKTHYDEPAASLWADLYQRAWDLATACSR